MSEVMRQLREEHRHIATLLRALERQLAIFDAAEQPDYDVLAAIADYFAGFPDCCHHPKEDLVYRKLCERDPTLAGKMANVEAEHAEISALARRFREAVQNVLKEAEIPREAFHDVARRFVSDQRRHMQMEEEHLFPHAEQTLTPDDWAAIDRQAVHEVDPLFGGDDQKFATLRDDILRWQAEDEAAKE